MEAESTATFGALLRRRRVASGFTQEALAERSGLSERAISDLERGVNRAPRRDSVRSLAEALGLTAAERADWEAARRRLAVRLVLPTAARRLREIPRDRTSPRHNLPLQLTSFVGRERELADVTRRIADGPDRTRLLTLTGTGGCGKTRLALEVAARLVDAFADGVWLVELAPLADTDLVPLTVAAVLGVQAGSEQPLLARLVDALRSKQLLILLDNCEHLIQASARLADGLLRTCPGVQVLATSRESLGIPGEVRLRVPSLAVPQPEDATPWEQLEQIEAVRLFVERAQAVVPDFEVTRQNAPALAQVCQQLDGIPLALELAAARLTGLSVEQLAGRLDQRFQLLTGGSRTALPRQQTLAATVAWSYDLLDDAERTLFDRLAVFAGGFTLDMAEAVSGEQVLGPLLRLVEKSLVVAEPAPGGDDRYRLLETLRQDGREKLVASAEAETIARRHAELCLALARQAETELRGPRQIAWLKRLDHEHNNLRAGLEWLIAHDRWVDALRLAAGLGDFWTVRGHYAEGRARLTEILAQVEAPREPALRARAYRALTFLAWRQGEFEQGDRYQEAFHSAAAEAGEGPLIAEAVAFGGRLATRTAPGLAWDRLNEALTLARQFGLRSENGFILVDLGMVAAVRGDLGGATPRLAEGLAILREVGDEFRVAVGLNLACEVAICRGDYRAARELAEEYWQIAHELGDRSGQANCRMRLAEAAWGEGDVAAAAKLAGEAARIYQDVADYYGVAWAAAQLSRADLERGDVKRARARAEESLTLLRRYGMHEGLLTIVLGAAGDAALAGGEMDVAAARYREGLALRANRRAGVLRVALLDGLARVAAARNRPTLALRLAGAVTAERARLGALAPPSEREWLDHALAPLRQTLTDQAWSAAYAQGQALTLDQAIVTALEENDT